MDSGFDHDKAAKAGRVASLHPSLDLRVKPQRECRDSADSPLSVPVACLLDVTGSMGEKIS